MLHREHFARRLAPVFSMALNSDQALQGKMNGGGAEGNSKRRHRAPQPEGKVPKDVDDDTAISSFFNL
jgi:hypothetical protein